MRTIGGLVEELASIPTTGTLFNQYRDRISEIDLPNAPAIRRDNLRRYLEAMQRGGGRQLWIFEAPSKRGALRTGIPQTSDARLAERSNRLGLVPPLIPATRQGALDAAPSLTSTIVWNVIGQGPVPTLWNAVMLRPHAPGDLMRTRAPRLSELRVHASFVTALVSLLEPVSVVWVGRKAERMSALTGIAGFPVRHPANGGAAAFRQGIEQMLRTNAILHGRVSRADVRYEIREGR